MKKPEGLSLFTQQQQIIEWASGFDCPANNGCRTVGDCNGDCRKTITKVIIMIIFLFFSTITFAQTATYLTPDGNTIEVQLIFKSEQEVVDHYQIEPTGKTHTDVKKNVYQKYKKGKSEYYIKPTKTGYKRFKITVKDVQNKIK